MERVSQLLPGGVQWTRDEGEHPHETHHLKLDSTRARERLGWTPPLGLEEAVQATVEWYEAWRGGGDLRGVTLGEVRRGS